MLNVELIENKEELAVVLERVIGHCYHGIPEYQIEEAFEEVIENKLHSRQLRYGKEVNYGR